MSSSRRGTTQTAVRGTLAGGAAYLVGYVVTYAWRGPDVNDSIRGINAVAELLGAQVIPTWKAVGWLFYGEHFVSTRVPSFGGDAMVNFVGRGNGMDVLYLLPLLLLLLAGAIAARTARSSHDIGDGAVRGGAIVAGYLPLAAIGAIVTSYEIGETGRSIAPDLLTAVLLAGVIFPVAIGGIGGAIASRV